MRIALFGTSNGLVADGYSAALKTILGVKSIANYSLGASPIDFFAYRSAMLKRGAVDFAILESAVNDAACCRAGTYTPQRMVDALRHAIFYLRDIGVEPLGFIIPGRTRDSSTEAVLACQAETFSKERVAFFDGGKFFHGYAAEAGVDYETLFRDAAHPRSEIIRQLSEGFLRNLAPLTHGSVVVDRFSGWAYSYTDASDVRFHAPDGVTLKPFSTTLVQGHTIDVGRGQTLAIQMSDDEELVALVLNIRSTAAYLRVEGVTSIFKDAVFEQNPNDTKIVTSPILSPVHPWDSKIQITPLAERPTNMERSYFTDKQGEAHGVASIAGFVSRSRMG